MYCTAVLTTYQQLAAVLTAELSFWPSVLRVLPLGLKTKCCIFYAVKLSIPQVFVLSLFYCASITWEKKTLADSLQNKISEFLERAIYRWNKSVWALSKSNVWIVPGWVGFHIQENNWESYRSFKLRVCCNVPFLECCFPFWTRSFCLSGKHIGN